MKDEKDIKDDFDRPDIPDFTEYQGYFRFIKKVDGGEIWSSPNDIDETFRREHAW